MAWRLSPNKNGQGRFPRRAAAPENSPAIYGWDSMPAIVQSPVRDERSLRMAITCARPPRFRPHKNLSHQLYFPSARKRRSRSASAPSSANCLALKPDCHGLGNETGWHTFLISSLISITKDASAMTKDASPMTKDASPMT